MIIARKRITSRRGDEQEILRRVGSSEASKIQYQERHIVLLHAPGSADRPTRNFPEQFVGKRSGRKLSTRRKKLRAAGNPKLFARNAFGLRQSVGVKHIPISRLQLHFDRRVL